MKGRSNGAVGRTDGAVDWGEWGWWAWGVGVGRNVIVVFRPVLFHNTVTTETHFIPEQRICLCLCDRFLSLCVCLTSCYCLMFRCVWLSRASAPAAPLSWAHTPCQTWHLVYTVTVVLPTNPLTLNENESGSTSRGRLCVCSDYWGPGARASIFTLLWLCTQ